MIITSRAENKPMKVIDMSNPASAKAYAGRPPEDTHTKEELDALHRAIRFTHEFMKKESDAKMEEVSPMDLPLPRMPRI